MGALASMATTATSTRRVIGRRQSEATALASFSSAVALVGLNVGVSVGDSVVGVNVGSTVGVSVALVGLKVGVSVGVAVVGSSVGSLLGFSVGKSVGFVVGNCVSSQGSHPQLTGQNSLRKRSQKTQRKSRTDTPHI